MSKPLESRVSASGSQHAVPLSRSLCRRYVFAEFRFLSVPICDGDALTSAHWRWALGVFRRDQFEVLGAWPAHHPLWRVVRDLHERGLEHLKAVEGIRVEDWASQYPDPPPWLTACESNDTSSPALCTLGPRRLAVLRSAKALSTRLQTSLERAIKRRAPFADGAAAEAFLAKALEKADRRFYEVPKARLRRARTAGTASGGGDAAKIRA